MNSCGIDFFEISKSYPSFNLYPASFSIPEGSIAGLVGQNGAGKTTLIKCALRLVAADGGEMRIPSLGTGRIDRIALLRVVGYVPESPSFYEWMSVGRLLQFVSKFHPGWDHQYAKRLLTAYRLDAGKQIKHLSKGMRAKVALVLALAFKPVMLILDEPTSGLDPVMKAEFLDELDRLVTAGEVRSILISSHILGEIAAIARQVVVLQNGHMVENCDRDSLIQRWRKVVFAFPDGQRPPSALAGRVLPNERGSRMLVVRAKDGSTIERLQSAGASQIQVVEPSIEEVLLAAVQDEEAESCGR
jgi:ABC-2 type transport system ATP-binding protein